MGRTMAGPKKASDRVACMNNKLNRQPDGGGTPVRKGGFAPLAKTAVTFALWAALFLGNRCFGQAKMPSGAPAIQPANRQITINPSPAGAKTGPNLIVIIHGFRDNINVATKPNNTFRAYNLTADGWVPRLAGNFRKSVNPGWDVWMYDWNQDASPPGFNLFQIPAQYTNASIRAISHGDDLGRLISGSGYTQIHLISHSLGAEVSERAAEWFAAFNKRFGIEVWSLQQTFLDGVNIHAASYGKEATLAEQYFIDGKRLSDHVGDSYKLAYNIALNDVNPYRILDVDPNVDSHRFPREWYELGIPAGGAAGGTTAAINLGGGKTLKIAYSAIPQSWYDLIGYGFGKEVADKVGKPWPPANNAGTLQRVTGVNAAGQYNLGKATQVTAYSGTLRDAIAREVQADRTGIVSVIPDTSSNPITAASSITLTAVGTNQAAMVFVVDTTASVTNTSLPAFLNTLSFDYTFDEAETNGLNGLSVFMPDDTGTNWVDIRDAYQQFVFPDGTAPTADATFDPLPPGQYAFAFALDAYSGYSSVTITNLQFSLNATAPMLFPNPPITSLGYTNGTFSVSFQSANLCGYVLEFTGCLADPMWDAVEQIVGDGTILTVTDTNATAMAGFYRVRAQ